VAIPKRILRGVENIRTHSGSADPAYRPYKAYLRLAFLEMERVRRGKEREASMFRVDAIDARAQEIDSEKERLLREIGECADSAPSPEARKLTGPSVKNHDSDPPRQPEPGTFKIKY